MSDNERRRKAVIHYAMACLRLGLDTASGVEDRNQALNKDSVLSLYEEDDPEIPVRVIVLAEVVKAYNSCREGTNRHSDRLSSLAQDTIIWAESNM